MKNENGNALVGFAAILVFLVVFVACFYWLITGVGLEASLIWSTLIAAIGWMISEHISRKREHQKLLAEQKREMYFKFLDFILSFTNQVSVDSTQEDKISDDELHELSRWSLRLGLVGSDEVVKAWNSFKQQSAIGDTDKLFVGMEALLTAMREDCGHYSSGLDRGELLALMIKSEDMHEVQQILDRSNL